MARAKSALLLGAAVVALLSWACVLAAATNLTTTSSASTVAITSSSPQQPRDETTLRTPSSGEAPAAPPSSNDASFQRIVLDKGQLELEEEKRKRQQQGLLEQRLQKLQEQRRLCARCDCFALRRAAQSANATVRVSLDENLDDVPDTTTSPSLTVTTTGSKAKTTPLVPPVNQVLVINCTSRLLAEELPRWSWPARLSAGEAVAAETWAEFRGGDLSGVSRLPQLPFHLTRLSLADNRLR
ncbi:hypothetical protein FOCC_FOCC010712, partial [Frankliniella occidentalis]